jgi:uncharacterized membrane protein
MTDRHVMLRARIMRRVWAIRAMRLAVHSPAVKGALLLLVLWRTTNYVSYGDVLANAPSLADLPSFTAFVFDAVVTTEGVTLALLGVAFTLVGWAILDRAFSHRHAFA